jgi:hypothetical protein
VKYSVRRSILGLELALRIQKNPTAETLAGTENPSGAHNDKSQAARTALPGFLSMSMKTLKIWWVM